MTTTLSARGQIVIPHDIRAQMGLCVGDDFLVLSAETGEIVLRPLRKAGTKSLTEALRSLHGLELERSDEPVRDVLL